jgi:tetratricopeptide (TPR) repeat protein
LSRFRVQKNQKTRIFRMRFMTFQGLATKIQVRKFSSEIYLDHAMAYCYRGRCYMHMQEYKRALYDFSAAIRAEQKAPDYSNLAWYY